MASERTQCDSSTNGQSDLVLGTNDKTTNNQKDSPTKISKGELRSRRRRPGKKRKIIECENVNVEQDIMESENSLGVDEINNFREKINSRERERMQNLNVAMDALRDVIPYNKGPSVRKLSKIGTLQCATSYIKTLCNAINEMRGLLNDVYRTHGDVGIGHAQSVPREHARGTSLNMGLQRTCAAPLGPDFRSAPYALAPLSRHLPQPCACCGPYALWTPSVQPRI